ncbi:MAG: anaerobic glycerol-3-phosphate dehydrogenase subunit C [Candidatus Viridilinea halotolerans]|uniref:Anaerobic glycerol-3-phosphate dehydrogenase subunit C n=1 Tax=Candidatus Viridilinea halotolerans TaxID=2491704 RepID=A0A426TSM3_9CHLR|nr:MAG: anaerobic glycerol-3-phosphate dehydrogenase subunit C [Candidatus Viridilinea halotolerans]
MNHPPPLNQGLDQCIKCNICTSACPVAAVSDRFPGPKYVGPQAQRFRREGQPVPDDSVDYCSGCRVCNEVCPTGVPIAQLNARARAQIVAERGVPLRNWLIARTDMIGRLSAGPQAPLVNFVLRLAPTRWLAHYILGIHRHAPLPLARRHTFRAWVAERRVQGTGNREQGTGNREQGTENREQGTENREQRTENREQGTENREQGTEKSVLSSPSRLTPPTSTPPTSTPPTSTPPTFSPHASSPHASSPHASPIVYFHGCATQAYEPHVGQAALAVLEHHGYEVLVPPQNCCGLPLISNGDFVAARRAHLTNVRHLLAYVRQGIPVVGTSTSCTLTLKEEAPEILGLHSADVQLLAAHTYDLFEFLRLLAEAGQLRRDFRPMARQLPYHIPCQYRAHRIGQPVVDVLSLIPGLQLSLSPAACCGIAGTYGIKREKYAIAMAVGQPLFNFIRQSGSDLALCDSETCRWQISHATGVATKHPIELLAEAYNLSYYQS